MLGFSPLSVPPRGHCATLFPWGPRCLALHLSNGRGWGGHFSPRREGPHADLQCGNRRGHRRGTALQSQSLALYRGAKFQVSPASEGQGPAAHVVRATFSGSKIPGAAPARGVALLPGLGCHRAPSGTQGPVPVPAFPSSVSSPPAALRIALVQTQPFNIPTAATLYTKLVKGFPLCAFPPSFLPAWWPGPLCPSPPPPPALPFPSLSLSLSPFSSTLPCWNTRAAHATQEATFGPVHTMQLCTASAEPFCFTQVLEPHDKDPRDPVTLLSSSLQLFRAHISFSGPFQGPGLMRFSGRCSFVPPGDI